MNRWVHLLGGTIAVAGLVWLFVSVKQSAEALPPVRWDHVAVLGASGAIGIYLLALFSAATAWAGLIRARGELISLPTAWMALLVSQPAKYVPGNVGHYLGRLALGRELGLTTGTLLLTLGIEMTCGVAAGMVASILAFPLAGLDFLPGEMMHWRITTLLVLTGLMLLALRLRGAAMAHRRPGSPQISRTLPRGMVSAGLVCFGLASLNFLLFGASASLLAVTVLRVPAPPFLALSGVFAAAWVAGFLTPGAPAGLGVREAVLVIGLSPVCGTGVALSLPILFRVVTTLGDGAGFAVGMLLRRVQRRDA